MKTIKLIDLLNKIANGEELPKEIKVKDEIYHYDETDCNEFYRYTTMTNELLTDYADLNDEVEIIEGTITEIEKIEEINADYHKKEVYYENLTKEEIVLDLCTLKNKFNQLIDKVNEINKGK